MEQYLVPIKMVETIERTFELYVWAEDSAKALDIIESAVDKHNAELVKYFAIGKTGVNSYPPEIVFNGAPTKCL